MVTLKNIFWFKYNVLFLTDDNHKSISLVLFLLLWNEAGIAIVETELRNE